MSRYTIKKGLDLPIAGDPVQSIEDAPQPTRVALIADDYIGMKPTMQVQVGDVVRRGQLLFEDKKTTGVRYTAPGGGEVVAVHRGDRRALLSVVIELDETERSGGHNCVSFASYTGKAPSELSRDEAQALLIESGLWTTLRQRPFSRVADPAETPAAIFVTAADTNPHAPSVDVAMKGREADFERGVIALTKLTEGPVYVCKGADSSVRAPSSGKVQTEEFSGPHPAGTAGLHIHFLKPVSRLRTVWYVGYQDVIAIGKLFGEGVLDVERVISLAGPGVKNPRLLRTRVGASVDDLTAGELKEGEMRLISGSVLSGRRAAGPQVGYLGRYHLQISALAEGRKREVFGWLGLGLDKYSTINAYLGGVIPGLKFNFTTTTNGSDRAMVPIGMYEAVMPMDIMPTFLLRALLMQDIERCEELGVLELDEEDLALCTFVCPGKSDYGPLLRKLLTTIEKEG
ncbi:MAG: Na(+)-translocating NADH-quinone reductase subunit A [Acidobacteria bacterium]|nr:Na(+)-translocating NADH-quinone reductase subunit A [Acidobacteriota bacterium]